MELRARNERNPFPRPIPMMDCAQCGATILASSWSEHVDDHRVRDLWECHVCDYTFETEVVFPTRRR